MSSKKSKTKAKKTPNPHAKQAPAKVIRKAKPVAKPVVVSPEVLDAKAKEARLKAEAQANKEAAEKVETADAAEIALTSKRIAGIDDAGWHALREVLRQHGFASIFKPI